MRFYIVWFRFDEKVEQQTRVRENAVLNNSHSKKEERKRIPSKTKQQRGYRRGMEESKRNKLQC